MDPFVAVDVASSVLILVAAAALGALLIVFAPLRASPRLLLLTLATFVGYYAAYLLHLAGVPGRLDFWAFALLQPLGLMAYLRFAAVSMDSPLLRPFRGRGALVVFALLYATLLILLLTRSALAIDWRATEPVVGPVLAFLSAGTLPVYAYVLIGTLHAAARVRSGTALAARTRAYAWAFATQDACIVVGAVVFYARPRDPFALAFDTALVAIGIAVAHALVVRAILKERLFDVDLRLKRGMRRGTLIGIFLAAFFVVAAIAEQYLEQRLGLVAGGAAVGLLLFATRPIERAAARVADAAMPGVRDTSEYRTVRKREVYRAAVESAMEDGGISDKERSVLATLADQLGLGAREALEIEREAHAVATKPS